MIVKEILEYNLSYWERLWDTVDSHCRQNMLTSRADNVVGPLLSKAGIDIPKEVRNYYIGHPYEHFDKVPIKCSVLCDECWEREWRGEVRKC